MWGMITGNGSNRRGGCQQPRKTTTTDFTDPPLPRCSATSLHIADTMSRLPPELCRIILYNLEDDVKVLKKSSLVDRAWAREAQHLLFTHHLVRIGVPADVRSFPPDKKGGKRKPSDSIRRVGASPHMRRGVRAVRLNVTDMCRILSNGPRGAED